MANNLQIDAEIQGLPHKYVVLSKVGIGTTSTVYFCTPRPPTTTTTNNHAPPPPTILAVKVITKDAANQARAVEELRALRTITSQTDSAAKALFPQLLAHDPGEFPYDTCAWLALTAYPSAIPLSRLEAFCRHHHRPIPDELLLHLFAEQKKALEFLHVKCGLAHADLHSGNVLLSPHGSAPAALRRVVLIDFSHARGLRYWSGGVGFDRSVVTIQIEGAFRIARGDLVDERLGDGYSEGWVEFFGLLRQGPPGVVVGDEIWGAMGRVAEGEVGAAARGRLEEIEGLVEEAAGSAEI